MVIKLLITVNAKGRDNIKINKNELRSIANR